MTTRAHLETALAGLGAAQEALRIALASLPANIPPPPVARQGRDLAKFYALVRKPLFDGALTQPQVDGCELILRACPTGWPASWTAYVLATAYHETGHTMQPVPEVGRGKGHPYGLPDPPRSKLVYYGRGYVQLTWRNNYARAEAELGLPLVANPDLAMRPDVAVAIIVRGMDKGWFTGKAMNAYLPAVASRANFAAARRVVNGTDRADRIADYAMHFQAAVLAATPPEKVLA